MLVLTCVAKQVAQAETFNVLYTFTGQQNDGANPYAGLTMDAGGSLYGTTFAGGSYGQGTVFELRHSGSNWIMMTLYSFQGGNDGAQPRARVIFGPDGALYGTTFNGGGTGCGGKGCGTVFSLRAPIWKESVLYRFTGGTDGGLPLGDLVFDTQGSILWYDAARRRASQLRWPRLRRCLQVVASYRHVERNPDLSIYRHQ